MAESLTTSLVFHITALGRSERYCDRLYSSDFPELFGSDIISNSWRAELKPVHLVRRSDCSRFRLEKFVPKVCSLREHPRCDDGEKEVLDDVDELSMASEDKLQFLEERDEEKLSWRLLKLSRQDKIRSAMKLYASMDFLGLRPNSHACNALISCLLRNKHLDEALNIFESMKSNHQTTEHSYNLIIQAISKARGFESAFKTFEDLANNELHKQKLDQIFFNTMLSLSREEQDWRKSEEIWKTMKANNRIGNSVTYRLLVTTFLACHQYEFAIEAYQEMVQNGVQQDTATTEAAIMAFVKDGRSDLALTLFRGMMNRKQNPNVLIFNALIHSLGNNGQVDLAFKLFNCMKSLGHEPTAHTWNALLVGLCRSKRYNDAICLFERIKQENPSGVGLHLYNTVLMACQRLGFWRRALQIVWEMEGSGLAVPVGSYNRVIGACEVGNEPRVGLQVYRHMVHRKLVPDTFTLLSLIRSCIWGSLWEEVQEILKVVEPNAHLYNAAVQGLCLRGKSGAATKLYQEMRELGLSPDRKTWAMMLRHLPKR